MLVVIMVSLGHFRSLYQHWHEIDADIDEKLLLSPFSSHVPHIVLTSANICLKSSRFSAILRESDISVALHEDALWRYESLCLLRSFLLFLVSSALSKSCPRKDICLFLMLFNAFMLSSTNIITINPIDRAQCSNNNHHGQQEED